MLNDGRLSSLRDALIYLFFHGSLFQNDVIGGENNTAE
jgi:hypothetical protein